MKHVYGKWVIYHRPPPIPDRRFDWQFHHKDYDGPGDNRCGVAASLEEAKEDIDAIEEEEV